MLEALMTTSTLPLVMLTTGSEKPLPSEESLQHSLFGYCGHVRSFPESLPVWRLFDVLIVDQIHQVSLFLARTCSLLSCTFAVVWIHSYRWLRPLHPDFPDRFPDAWTSHWLPAVRLLPPNCRLHWPCPRPHLRHAFLIAGRRAKPEPSVS